MQERGAWAKDYTYSRGAHVYSDRKDGVAGVDRVHIAIKHYCSSEGNSYSAAIDNCVRDAKAAIEAEMIGQARSQG